MLSWVQYAYGVFKGDVAAGGFYTVGPLRGPAAITEVRCTISLSAFARFRLGASIVRSSAPTLENFNAGVKLGAPPAETSVASTDIFFNFAASGANPFELLMPCWVPFGAEPRWVCLFADREAGAADLHAYTTMRADRLWPDDRGVVSGVGSGQGRSLSPLEVLFASARRSGSKGGPARPSPAY